MIKDLVVDRSAFDRIIAAGGYISVPTGSAPDGNTIPVPKEDCRPRHGCGGLHRLRRVRGGVSECVRGAVHGRQDRAPGTAAAGSARAAEARARAWCGSSMPRNSESCTNIGECEAVCPKEIKLEAIARMNRDFLKRELGKSRLVFDFDATGRVLLLSSAARRCTSRAIATNGAPASPNVTGWPESPPTRTAGSSGSSPRNGTFMRSAVLLAAAVAEDVDAFACSAGTPDSSCSRPRPATARAPAGTC